MFVNCPSKFIVELPRHETKQDSSQREHTRSCDQEWPELRIRAFLHAIVKRSHGLTDLLHFYCRVDHHAKVVQAHTNDLNRVLQPQGVPDEPDLVDEAENENGKPCRYRARRRAWILAIASFLWETLQRQTRLELSEDVCFERHEDQALEDGDEHKRPGPGAVGHIHLARFLAARAHSRCRRQTLPVMVSAWRDDARLGRGAAEAAARERIVWALRAVGDAEKGRAGLVVGFGGSYFDGGCGGRWGAA